MKIVLRAAGLAALAGLGFWLWTVLYPSPEKIVLKKVASLAATATVHAGDGAMTRASKVGNFIAFFSTDAEISYDIPGAGARALSGREEIREAAAAGFSSVQSVIVQFKSATARVGPDPVTAEVSCTAEVSAGDSKDYGLQELKFEFRKIEGEWLITRVETVKTLQ